MFMRVGPYEYYQKLTLGNISWQINIFREGERWHYFIRKHSSKPHPSGYSLPLMMLDTISSTATYSTAYSAQRGALRKIGQY